MSCEALVLTGSLHITRKIHLFKASVSPFCFQQLVAFLVATRVQRLVDWKYGNHCCPPVASCGTTDSTWAITNKHICTGPGGGVRGFSLSFWAFAHLKSLILFLGKSVSPRVRMENPVQVFQPWRCQHLGVDTLCCGAALGTVGCSLGIPSTRCQ